MNGIITIVILLVVAHAVFNMMGMKNLVPRLLKAILNCFFEIIRIFFNELSKLFR